LGKIAKQAFRYYRQTRRLWRADCDATQRNEETINSAGSRVTLRFRNSSVAVRVGGPVERHWSNPNAHRLIYAAAPFRTATLKTLTAFNFRWPSILFSLVWTTFSRTGCPATPSACSSRLRQGNYLSSPSFPSCRIRRLLLPVPPFLSPCSSHSRLHRVLKDVLHVS